ncbi:MAG: hypothetical protein ACFE85_14015 [Candidatus Hodarchaeota archaeon]
MNKSKYPPNCYICGKDCQSKLDQCYYCICDITVCDLCLNSVKKNETTWICPHCSEERDIEGSRLFRNSITS